LCHLRDALDLLDVLLYPSLDTLDLQRSFGQLHSGGPSSATERSPATTHRASYLFSRSRHALCLGFASAFAVAVAVAVAPAVSVSVGVPIGVGINIVSSCSGNPARIDAAKLRR
jgi:hypothetical protein